MPPQIYIIGLDMLSALHGQTLQIIGAEIAAFNLVRDVGAVTTILAAKLVRYQPTSSFKGISYDLNSPPSE